MSKKVSIWNKNFISCCEYSQLRNKSTDNIDPSGFLRVILDRKGRRGIQPDDCNDWPTGEAEGETIRLSCRKDGHYPI